MDGDVALEDLRSEQEKSYACDHIYDRNVMLTRTTTKQHNNNKEGMNLVENEWKAAINR